MKWIWDWRGPWKEIRKKPEFQVKHKYISSYTFTSKENILAEFNNDYFPDLVKNVTTISWKNEPYIQLNIFKTDQSQRHWYEKLNDNTWHETKCCRGQFQGCSYIPIELKLFSKSIKTGINICQSETLFWVMEQIRALK